MKEVSHKKVQKVRKFQNGPHYLSVKKFKPSLGLDLIDSQSNLIYCCTMSVVIYCFTLSVVIHVLTRPFVFCHIANQTFIPFGQALEFGLWFMDFGRHFI